MHFRTRFRSDEDAWSNDGAKITSAECVASIQAELERGPVIVEHWFYRGATAPERFVFESWEDLVSYLRENASAGDAVDVWSFAALCTSERRIAQGKCPDEDGRVPARGAY